MFKLKKKKPTKNKNRQGNWSKIYLVVAERTNANAKFLVKRKLNTLTSDAARKSTKVSTFHLSPSQSLTAGGVRKRPLSCSGRHGVVQKPHV